MGPSVLDEGKYQGAKEGRLNSIEGKKPQELAFNIFPANQCGCGKLDFWPGETKTSDFHWFHVYMYENVCSVDLNLGEKTQSKKTTAFLDG